MLRSFFVQGMMRGWIALFLALGMGSFGMAEERLPEKPRLTLQEALSIAMDQNPEIEMAMARSNAEGAMVRSQYSLSDPKVGWMRESNLNLMQQTMGPMTLLSVSQEIQFPAKYYYLGAAQKTRMWASIQESDAKKLEIRKKIISAYYGLFAQDRIIALLEAQRETLREMARAAESRHATGAVPQQDEMKAHVEQTKIENEWILAQEERASLQADLNALLNREADHPIAFVDDEMAIPKLKSDLDEWIKNRFSSSKKIKQSEYLIQESQHKKTLAQLSYAPDLMFSYKRGLLNSPANAYAVGLEITFPLWFFAKQSGEVAQAVAMQTEAEKNFQKTVRRVDADVRGLLARVRSREKLLQIYQTALIPQTASTLNASRIAYQAGRTGFLELLDSERTLYETRIAYYQNLALFVESLSQLEEMVSVSLSDLPKGTFL